MGKKNKETCDVCGNDTPKENAKKDQSGVYCPTCWEKFKEAKK